MRFDFLRLFAFGLNNLHLPFYLTFRAGLLILLAKDVLFAAEVVLPLLEARPFVTLRTIPRPIFIQNLPIHLEASQQAFLRVLQALPPLRRRPSLSSWPASQRRAGYP